MQRHSAHPISLFSSALRNRTLIFELTKREVLGRYRGSLLGCFWSFLNPCLLLAVYAFVFGTVFKSSWQAGESQSDFAMILFAGLIVFNIFAESITRAPTLIVSSPNYVKKVIFPLEILPGVALGAALVHAAISFLVWLLAYLVLFGVPPATLLLAPLMVAPLILFCLGLSWVLASLGVYLRDLGQLLGLVVTVTMFMSSVFYPVTALPQAYQRFVLLSPITVAVEQFRQVAFFGRVPDWSLFGLQLAIGSVSIFLGFAWFQKTRKGFADVI